MASYPSAIKAFSTLSDDVDDVLASHQNDRGDEITAVETELGTNPKGTDADVKTRLDRLDGDARIKTWVSFNGSGTAAINDSFNVASLTDNGTGDYILTWDVDFANVNYAVVGNASQDRICSEQTGTRAVGTYRFQTQNPQGTVEDAVDVCVIAIGDQ